jgi:hypothetical protein
MRKLIAAIAILAALVAPASAQTPTSRTLSQLNTEIGTTGCSQPTCLFPDNTTGLITPFQLRQGLLDIVASVFGTTGVANSGSCDVRINGGAKQDGTTDDKPAFTACQAALPNGGVIYVPPAAATTCIKTAFTPNAGILIQGAGSGYAQSGVIPPDVPVSEVGSCGSGQTVFNFANGQTGLIYIDVDCDTFVASQTCVIMGGVRNIFYQVGINNGSIPLKVTGCGDCIISATRATHAYGGTSTANVLVQNGGFNGIRNIWNTHWPILPAAQQLGNPAPWTPGAYAVASVATATGPDGGTYFIQTINGGTSANPLPTLQPYGVTFTDGGGVQWQLLRPQGVNLSGGTPTNNFFDIQCDSGGTFNEWATDHSGGGIGIGFTDTLATGGCTGVQEVNGTFGNNYGDGIMLGATTTATSLQITAGWANTCAASQCAGIDEITSFGGSITISNFTQWKQAHGLRIRGPGNLLMTGSRISGSSTAAVSLGAVTMNNVTIVGNDFSTDPFWGNNAIGFNFNPAPAAIDFFKLSSNNLNGIPTPYANLQSPTGTHNDFGLSGPSWVLLNVLTASNSALLADTTSFNASYNDYAVMFDNVVPVSNAVDVELQVHSGGAFQTANYIQCSGAATNLISLTSAASNVANTATTVGFSGILYFHNINQTTGQKMVTSARTIWATGPSTLASAAPCGVWQGGTGALDGFQVFLSSGNISSGSIKVYALKASAG